MFESVTYTIPGNCQPVPYQFKRGAPVEIVQNHINFLCPHIKPAIGTFWTTLTSQNVEE